MKLLLLACLVALSQAKSVNVDETEWHSFKETYGKTYESDSVEATRKQMYFANKEKIEAHNARYAAGEVSYYLGINKFADMSHEEFVQKYNNYKKSNRVSTNEVFDSSEGLLGLPTTVDWRKKGYVTAIKDQGDCGSCWAFSTTGSLEGQHYKATGKLVSLSEQQLVDCSTENDGCNGGEMDVAFAYIKSNGGIDTESCYPYSSESYYDDVAGTCSVNKTCYAATLKKHVDVKSGSETALKKAVAKIGPISVAIDAGLDSFQLYAGGVYNETSCGNTMDDLDHGVLVVGYGTKNKKPYWLVKNSWGTSWGIEGYIMMTRNSDNQCGIATDASYPVV